MILQGKTMILESGSQKIEALVYDTLRNIFSKPVSGATFKPANSKTLTSMYPLGYNLICT